MVKNCANNFTQRYKTKLRITCSVFSEWNKILQVLAISIENTVILLAFQWTFTGLL